MRELTAIFFSLLLLSCNHHPVKTNQADTSNIQKPATDTITAVQNNTFISTGTLVPWEIDFEKKTKKANPDFNTNSNADSVITGLNQLFPEIKMEKVKLSHDTLFTIIKDSYFLTDGMGTTGAATYFANAIINLTSIRGIKHVHISFLEGSHASPGTWSKNEFDDYAVIR